MLDVWFHHVRNGFRRLGGHDILFVTMGWTNARGVRRPGQTRVSKPRGPSKAAKRSLHTDPRMGLSGSARLAVRGACRGGGCVGFVVRKVDRQGAA